MRIDVTLPVVALREIDIHLGTVFTSVHFNVEGNRLVITALALGKVEVTIKFHPALEDGKVILQDAEVHGVLGLANMSEGLILAKMSEALEESSKKLDIHALSVDPEKVYFSFTPKENKEK